MLLKLCLKCGKRMDNILALAGADHHPTCEPIDPTEIAAESLRQDLVDIIRWTDSQSERSQQTGIGPSELGDDCERKIAYRLAGIAPVNQWMDPLPAIVGTAVHNWLETAVTRFQQVHHMDRWLTETTVQPDPMVIGHADLYDRELQAVIDYKTVSPTKLKEWKSSGPPEHYKDQVNLYGRGFLNAGLPVSYVCLVAIPRSGWLSDVRVWMGRPEPDRVARVLGRMYSIADKLIAQGDDISVASIDPKPSRNCGYCPWYRGGTEDAGITGCPGNAGDARQKYASGLIAPAN